MKGYEIRHILTEYIKERWPDAMILDMVADQISRDGMYNVDVTFRTMQRGHLEDYVVLYMVDVKEKKVIPARQQIHGTTII